VNEQDRENAARVRSLVERGLAGPETFRSLLLRVAPSERDAWLNHVLGLGELPEDGPDLPRDCVPYVPCSVDALLRVVDQIPVRSSDVFVDVGSGVGRAMALVHLLTGATAIGVEIQRGLVLASRDLAARLAASPLSTVEGDAAALAGSVAIGSIFFLYCPFSGERLSQFLRNLEPLARTRELHVCCVDLPLPPCPWLTRISPASREVSIYRSTLHDETVAGCATSNTTMVFDQDR
jgi:hypothetical protein